MIMNDGRNKMNGFHIPTVLKEINRLRARDSQEEIGGLGLALKLYDHFHVETNPRVAEALENLGKGGAARSPPGE
jgi:hypothetical protein